MYDFESSSKQDSININEIDQNDILNSLDNLSLDFNYENEDNSIKDIVNEYESEDNHIYNNNIPNELNEKDECHLNMSEIIKERRELSLFTLDLKKDMNLKIFYCIKIVIMKRLKEKKTKEKIKF